MVLSRQQSKEAFNHILDNVLGRGDDTPLKKALTASGIIEIEDFISLDDATIDSFTYDRTANDTNVPLNAGSHNLAKIFITYFGYRVRINDPIEDWTSLTADEFNTFRLGPKLATLRLGAQPTTTPPPSRSTTSTTTHASSRTPAENFQRGIKRDPTLFPTLKDEKFNDEWHRAFYNQARAQGVEKVLDATYVPSTAEEIDLFDEQQKYVYAVLTTNVRTDDGKVFIRDHHSDHDAQRVYAKLHQHHLQSTKAKIASSDLLTYITSARIGSGDWKGSTHGFVLHWQNQVHLYERQGNAFDASLKLVMLQNAVEPIPELAAVKTTAELDAAKTGTPITYPVYCSLLLSQADSYDKRISSKPRARRTVYAHAFADDVQDNGEDFLDSHSGDDPEYDIDLPVSTLQAFAADRRPPNRDNRVRMPRERWQALDDDTKRLWDQLSDKAKATILGLNICQQ